MGVKAHLVALFAVVVFAGLACQTAFGYWSGAGAIGKGGAAAASVLRGATPTVKATDSTTVLVAWTAGELSNGVPADAYVIKRYDAETGLQVPIGAACAGTVVALTCAETPLPEGNWRYTVTPLYAANWRGAESAKSAPVNTGPAYRTVELGEATGYAVLGASTVTSAAVSALTGDLGVSPGTAVTGFRPPGTVSGTIHSNDPSAAKAQADVGLAYADAAGRSPAIADSGVLGGRTLTRGVYKAATFAIDGDVTLDGRNDPGAVFIFQAGSTLLSTASTQVRLINGAQACNVFWQVGSSATLGASSTFVGSILAFTSISMGEGVTMEGRALAHGAAVTLIGDNVSVPECAQAEAGAEAGTFVQRAVSNRSVAGAEPGGGSVEATGLGGTDGRYSTSTTLDVAFDPGTDPDRDLAAGGARLMRATATLTSDGTADGICGTFGPYAQVGADDPTSPYADVVPADGSCYRYQYVIPGDESGPTVYTSGAIKVDATPPPAPALGPSELTGAYWSATGTTLFYRPDASGGFDLTASSVDSTSGISAYGFSIPPPGWTVTAEGAVATYGWSSASADPVAPNDPQTVTATDNAGLETTSSFTLSADSSPPSGGGLAYANGPSTDSALSVSFDDGTDALSGIDVTSGILESATAPLLADACGDFDAFAVIATEPISGTPLAVSGGSCYEYRYSVADNVGNRATYTSASIAAVGPEPAG